MAPPSLVSKYPGHVPLNLFQQAFLFVGSGLAAAVMPRRADLVATFGEASAFPVVIDRIRQQMLQDETGRRILKERPRITSTSLDLNYLRALPPNTLGNVYYSWLQREKVSPDTRLAVRYVQDPELAYIIQRYRECHDFYHSLLGMPVFMEGEEYVKIFEFANTGIPMTGLASLAGYFRLSGKARKRMHEIYLPWALTNGYSCKQLLNVYWEEQLERDIDELREEIGVVLSPDLRALRAKQSRKRPKELSAKVEQA